jgi:hypothetical protein
MTLIVPSGWIETILSEDVGGTQSFMEMYRDSLKEAGH